MTDDEIRNEAQRIILTEPDVLTLGIISFLPQHQAPQIIRDVNELLDAEHDPWGVASWWVSHNTRIQCRPLDLVGTLREQDIFDIAKGELDEY